MTPEILNTALVWLVPAVWIAALRYDDRRYLIAALGALTLSLFVNLSSGGWWTVWFASTLAVAGAVPVLHRVALRRMGRDLSRRSGPLLLQRDRARRRLEALVRERDARGVAVDEIQNRFALVQVMATKLEADEILQTLGQM